MFIITAQLFSIRPKAPKDVNMKKAFDKLIEYVFVAELFRKCRAAALLVLIESSSARNFQFALDSKGKTVDMACFFKLCSGIRAIADWSKFCLIWANTI